MSRAGCFSPEEGAREFSVWKTKERPRQETLPEYIITIMTHQQNAGITGFSLSDHHNRWHRPVDRLDMKWSVQSFDISEP